MFENGTNIINLTKADTNTCLNLDPYMLSFYNINTLKKQLSWVMLYINKVRIE